jgi:membrane fusion protein, copper/silver efflux system
MPPLAAEWRVPPAATPVTTKGTEMTRTMRTLDRRIGRALRRRWQHAPAGVRRVSPFLLVLLIGMMIGSTLFNRVGKVPTDGEDGIRAANNDDGTGEGIIWTCAMHPQIRQPSPGTCPICGMTLIPLVQQDDDHAGSAHAPRLVVSERAAALMSVQVWPVERVGAQGEVRLSGTIGYDETQVHDVVVRTEGQVERLYVSYENAAVRRGQRIADIYSPAIHAASLELLQARRAATAGGMPELVEAAASQLLAMGVGRAQVDRILDSGEPARTVSVFSPADGIVSELAARQGEWLMAGGRLMRVSGLSQVWAQFEAYERDLARLRVGAPMQFTVEAFPGRIFSGTIAFIDPVVDGGRRTARVRVQVPNPGGSLKPGMLVRGQGGSTAASPAATLAIPATAPLLTGQRSLVYVQVPGTERPTFEAREVTLGERRGGYWEVTSGVAEGELVVVNGAFRIDSELQIRGQPSMMAPPQQPADHGRVPLRLTDAAGRELERVVTAYLDVTLALSRDDAAASRRAAGALGNALAAAGFSGVDAAGAADWQRARDAMRQRAGTMARTSDLPTLRRELVQLSERLEAAIRHYPTERVGPLFRIVCPMVEGRTASWLARQEVVENPYYGAAMLDCGEVEGKVAG